MSSVRVALAVVVLVGVGLPSTSRQGTTLEGRVAPHAERTSVEQVAATLLKQEKAWPLPAIKSKAKRPIEKGDPLFHLPDGDSRAVLLQLQPFTSAYDVKLASRCNCAGPSKSVFVPTVAFFTADLTPTTVLQEEAFVDRSGELAATVPIGPDRAADRFALVFTRGDLVGKELGTLKTAQGLLMKINFPYLRAAYGQIDLEVSAHKTR